MVKCLLEHGAGAIEIPLMGMTALLYAAEYGRLKVIQYLLSSEGGASNTETDDEGESALLLAAGCDSYPAIIQWLLEHGGAQITDADYDGGSVWTTNGEESLPYLLMGVYAMDKDGEYVTIDGEYVPTAKLPDRDALTAMLRVMVLHGGPPESLIADLAPPFKQIVHDGARLRARLPW
jgi:ankyrin repeat protein